MGIFILFFILCFWHYACIKLLPGYWKIIPILIGCAAPGGIIALIVVLLILAGTGGFKQTA